MPDQKTKNSSQYCRGTEDEFGKIWVPKNYLNIYIQLAKKYLQFNFIQFSFNTERSQKFKADLKWRLEGTMKHKQIVIKALCTYSQELRYKTFNNKQPMTALIRT